MRNKTKTRGKTTQNKPTKRTNARANYKSKNDDNLSAKNSLMEAGKKLFAQKGLSGTSIRDIAQMAKVNSSMISYYFSGKEGLYKECLRQIGESRLSFAQTLFTNVDSKEEFRLRLELFMKNLFSLYLEDRDAGLIIVREYDRIHSPAEKIFKETFLKIFELLIDFFKEAQEKSFVSKEKDSFVLASLFFGCLSSQMRLDHIKDKVYNRSLKLPEEQKKVVDHLIDFVTTA